MSGIDIVFIANKIIEKLSVLRTEVDCAIACVSGGIDSTTSAIIAKKALGEKVYPIFIDTGFMRMNEGIKVKKALEGLLDLEIHDYAEQFISRIEGLEDAEEKRIAFREMFYTVVKKIADEKGCSWVVQGTIKADVIETVGGIKTQHNVLTNAILQKYGFKVIEPLIDLYKNEVRALAKYLGLPNWLIERQPFPGPGLLIRTVGKLYREKLELVRRLTDLVEQWFSERGFSQYFPAVWEYDVVEHRDSKELSYDVYKVMVTGVLEGKRTYGHPVIVRGSSISVDLYNVYKLFEPKLYPHILIEIGGRDRGRYVVAIRIVKTENFIVADVGRVGIDELKKFAETVMMLEPEVRVVAYDVTPKPPATIEYE
jgi:GMP synthase (glutamine-hydrolysing)